MNQSRWLQSGLVLIVLAAALVFVLIFKSQSEPESSDPGKKKSRFEMPAATKAERGKNLDASSSVANDKHTRSLTPRSFKNPDILRALDALETADDAELSGKLAQISAAWPEDTVSSSLASLFANPSTDPTVDLLKNSLLRRWATLDPAAAAAWANFLSPDGCHAHAIDQVALAWAASDPVAAWQWASGLPAGPARESALLSLVYELSHADPALALSRADSLSPSSARVQWMEHTVANWAVQDPQAAQLWVKSIQDASLQNSVLASLVISWAENDPSSAATLAANEMRPGPDQFRAIAAIVQRWSQQDPVAASTWVDSFPDGPMKENAREHIAAQSTAHDP